MFIQNVVGRDTLLEEKETPLLSISLEGIVII